MPYKDPEQRRSYGRSWIKRHPEKAREAMRRWRQRHPAEHAAEVRSHYERHRERLAAYFAQYRREHRDVRQRADARRQARKRGAPGSHTTVDWIWLLQLWNWTCAYCGKRGAALQPDHRVPLARGGSNSIDNILPACPSCNMRKGLMDEDEFRARLGAEQRGQQL